MSIEIDPVDLEFEGVLYQVFANICEEFSDQIDFIRIVRKCDQLEMRPTANTFSEQVLLQKALAVAAEQLPDLEWDNGADDVVIDYADV